MINNSNKVYEINHKGYIAYSIDNVIFDLSGKIYKSIAAFKNYIGKVQTLPKYNKSSMHVITGALHNIEHVFNNLKK